MKMDGKTKSAAKAAAYTFEAGGYSYLIATRRGDYVTLLADVAEEDFYHMLMALFSQYPGLKRATLAAMMDNGKMEGNGHGAN